MSKHSSYSSVLLSNWQRKTLLLLSLPVPCRNNYYKILGVKDGASLTMIKHAYIKLLSKWHLSKDPLEKAYDEIEFKRISKAFQVMGLDSPEGSITFIMMVGCWFRRHVVLGRRTNMKTTIFPMTVSLKLNTRKMHLSDSFFFGTHSTWEYMKLCRTTGKIC